LCGAKDCGLGTVQREFVHAANFQSETLTLSFFHFVSTTKENLIPD